MDIISTYTYSSNYPEIIENEISRDNIVETLIKTLASNDIILLAGEEEIGKTTFLGQFGRKNPLNVISIFIKPYNEFSTNLESILYDILAQIHFILNNESLNDDIVATSELVQQYINKLNRSKRNKTFYFLLDGFEEVDPKNSFQLMPLFNILPFGYNNFKFIISEDTDKFREIFLSQSKLQTLKVYSYPFAAFGFDETVRFLSKITLEKHQVSEIMKITNSLPGRIKIIADSNIDGKLNFDEILEAESFNQLLEKQWMKIKSPDDELRMFLAILAFEQKNSFSFLTDFLKMGNDDLKIMIAKIPFLVINGENVEFTSTTFKNFTKSRLNSFKSKVSDAVILHLSRNKDSVESILELPRRFDQAQNYQELLRMMTDENFKRIIDNKESLSFLEEQTEFGIKAAHKLDRNIDLYRLTLQKSCISEVKKVYIWKTEIEAKIELKDFESAFQLAFNSILKEERFKLLVFIAKKKKEKGLSNDENTLELIQTLYAQIDFASYFDEEQIIDLASDLLYTFPNLAIEVIEKSSGKDMYNKSDWGFAKLAMVMKNLKGGTHGDDETLEKINSRIKNPTVKNFSNAFSYLYGDESIESFIAKCDELETPLEKLQVVRLYLRENHKLEKIEQVIEYALDILLLASAEVPISATVLKELTYPLSSIIDKNKLLNLSTKFHSLKSISKEKGPTVNHIKFLMHLALADLKYDQDQGDNELYEIYEEIESQYDTGIKLECMTIFYSYLKRIYDENPMINQFFDLEKDILPSIVKSYDYLINNVSQHHTMATPILNELAGVNPEMAISFVKKINTRYRRDSSYLIVLETHLENEFTKINFQYIDTIYKSLLDIKSKNSACIHILERISEVEKISENLKGLTIEYIKKIDLFFDSHDKCYGYILSIKIAFKHIASDSFTEALLTKVHDFLKGLDDRYQKIDYGFQISSTLIAFEKKQAIIFHDSAEKEKKSLELDSPITLTLYFNSIRLCIRALSGVVRSGLEKEEDIRVLIDYINFLPSIVQQKILIINILFVLHKHDSGALCKKIYDENIKTFLLGLIGSNAPLSPAEKFEIITKVSPLAHIYQRSTLSQIISEISSVYRDFCYDSICDFILTKGISDEASSEDSNIKITLDEALEAIDLLKQMSTDFLINKRLNQIRLGIKNSNMPKHTLIIVASKIDELIKIKFPDSHNIVHDGFLLLGQVYLLAINQDIKEESWQRLFTKIESIPNKSDKAYVKSITSSLLPNKLFSLKAKNIKEIICDIDQISSYSERVNRYDDVKDYIKTVDLSECKATIKKAIADSLIENDETMFDVQKSLIDFAYKISEDFAEELMKIIDTDPARKPLTHKLKKHVKTISLRENIVNDKNQEEIESAKYLSEACAMLTYQFNAKRIKSKHLKSTQDWLLNANKLALSDSFAIYMCYIENLNARFATPDNQSKELTLQIFNEGIKSLQLIKVLAIKNSNKVITTKDIILSQDSNFLLVKPGDRNTAIAFIKKWAKAEVVDYLKICDPYFTFNDLELIKEIYLLKPDTKFTILGQYQHLGDATSRTFSEKWDEICDQEPPEIKIVMVGIRGSKDDVKIIPSPNHDRWYITYNSGLAVGTSFGSLGLNSNSAIQVMTSTSAKQIEVDVINKYIRREIKFHGTSKLLYDEFEIS